MTVCSNGTMHLRHSNTVPEFSRYSDWLRTGRSGFDSRRGLGMFLFDTVSRPALGPTQLRIQLAPRALKLTTHLHLAPRSKNGEWSYTSTPHYVFMGWCLVKDRDNFTFYFNCGSYCATEVGAGQQTSAP